MKRKILPRNFKRYLLAFFSLLLLGAVPYFVGSGLDNPEPLGKYLNNNFPATVSVSQGLPYVPIYPNLTFDSPLTFNELPNSERILVGQRDGKIYWFDKTPDVAQKNMLIDLSNKVGVVWDGGFLGLALHPEFGTGAGKNYFYTFYTTKDVNGNNFPNRYTTQNCTSEEYWGNFLILSRYTMNPNTMQVSPSSEQVLLKLRMYGTTHRGGGLVFGDDDFLYLTTGDQTAFRKSQDIRNNLDGGVLRLDVDMDPFRSHPPRRNMPDDHGFSDEITGNGYWIPNDNPFLSPSGQNFEEYYSMGHRNPHRMTKDRATGDLYIGEVGLGRHEEINVVKKGGNFGWPVYEGRYKGNLCGNTLYNNMPHEEPLVAFPRSVANAIMGGYVYRGSEIPELQGRYICADYGNGEEIFSVDINTGSYEQLGSFSSTNIISFGEDKQGEMYILKQGVSTLYKLVTRMTFDETLPQALSQTGAFTNLANLTPTDGLIPYDLVESFWSDGAVKKRWVGIPNNGTHNTPEEQIDYSEDGNWDLPVGSVLIKHFEMPLNENNPSITKRLETRFSVKAADGNFYFVTYKWNNAQTDAVLLTSGRDEALNIVREDGSTDVQIWRYPSRNECVTCHNSSTDGTIGLRTRYLNKDLTYPETGRTANQLVTLSHLGILNQTITDADTPSFLTYKSIDDPSASVDEKARSYMDLNCAYCHQAGSDVRADFDLRMRLDLEQTNLLNAGIFNPVGGPDAEILAVGEPNNSILYLRANSTTSGVAMPPIAKNRVDEEGVALIEEWITQLGGPPIVPVTNVQVTPSTIDLEIGETFTLTATVEPANATDQTVSWGSSNLQIATIDDNGLVTAISPGVVDIAVTTADGPYSASARITVLDDTPPEVSVYNVLVSPTTVALEVGETVQLTGAVEPSNATNQNVSWISNNPAIATIDSNGRVTAVGAGIIDVTVSAEDGGYSASSIITVTGGPQPEVSVYNVLVSPTTVSLEAGETVQLTATTEPSNATNQNVSWISNNPAIATIDSNGLVTAVGAGVIDVTVSAEDGGYSASSFITVTGGTPPPVSVYNILVAPNEVTLGLGETFQLNASTEPSNATNQSVTWFSNNPNIAAVDTSGLVTATGLGEIDVTAVADDGGYTASAIINVVASSQSSAVNVFPIPASGRVNVDLAEYDGQEVEIKLYNQNNSLLETFRIDQDHQDINELILNNYPSGYYYLLFQTSDSWSTRPIIIN